MKQGYKESELGIIPVDWEIKKLGDIGEFKNGINKSKEDFGFGFPLINLNDVFENSLLNDNTNCTLVNCNEKERLNYNLIKGDVLFIRSSVKPEGVGLTSLISNELKNTVFSGFIIRFRAKDDITIEFNFKRYVFNGTYFRNSLMSKSSISANTNINQESLNSLKIPLPPLQEQKAIAHCLATWDKAIESQTLLIKTKETRKKALMQQLLTGKKRLPGFTEEWKEAKLGELFSERNEVKITDLPLLSIGQEGVYPQTDSNKRDISNADKSKYKRIIPGDIGYNTMRMWQGRSALSSLEGIVSPAYTILKPKENVNSYYFSILFKTSKLTNLFWRNSQGLVDDTLNCKYKDFSKIKYRVPSFEEQNAIATILNTSEKEIQIEKQKLVALQEQKKGIMQQLLTGKVRLIQSA